MAAPLTIGELARQALAGELSAMLALEPEALRGADPEALHRMRVSVRRMRAFADLFLEVMPPLPRELRPELKRLGDALGLVRDIDVQIEHLDHWLEKAPQPARACRLDIAQLLSTEREAAHDKLLGTITSARHDQMAQEIALLTSTSERWPPQSQVPASAAAPVLLSRLHAEAVTAARRARRQGNLKDLHRLRIASKRLRYALEATRQFHGNKLDSRIRSLVKLQDALGLMQDSRVASTHFRKLARTAKGSGELRSAKMAEKARMHTALEWLAHRCDREANHAALLALHRVNALDGKAWKFRTGKLAHSSVTATPSSSGPGPKSRPGKQIS